MEIIHQTKQKRVIMMKMMTKRALLLLAAFCLALTSFSQKKDFGIWYSISAEKEVFKNLDLGLDANIRTYNKASEIEEFFFDFGLTYKLNKYISAGAGYRFTEFKEDDDKFHIRHKWLADLRGKITPGDFDISLRLRFQQRFKTYYEDENDTETKDIGRVRFKTLYDIPSFPVNPYISAELFFPMFTTAERSIEKKRFVAGAEYNISKKHSVEAEYMFQRDHYPKLLDMNIISLNYQIKF
jgi:predicted porin